MDAGGLDWTDLKVLGAVVRRGSLVAAARELAIDATTVGRRLTALERAVGSPLFRRQRGARALTEVGQQVAALAEEVARRLTEVTHEIDAERGEPRGVVRLTTTEILASTMLAPALPALVAAHPQLSIELSTTPSRLDLRRGEADLALRFVQPEEPGVLRRKVGPIATSAWAAPSHVAGAKRRGALQAERLRIVAYGDGGRPENEWLDRALPGAVTVIRTASVGVVLEAVAAGVGVGVLPDRIAQARGLTRLSALGAPPQRALWLAMEPRAAKVPRVRAVADWVVTAVRGQ